MAGRIRKRDLMLERIQRRASRALIQIQQQVRATLEVDVERGHPDVHHGEAGNSNGDECVGACSDVVHDATDPDEEYLLSDDGISGVGDLRPGEEVIGALDAVEHDESDAEEENLVLDDEMSSEDESTLLEELATYEFCN